MEPIPTKNEMARRIAAYIQENKLNISYVSRKTGLPHKRIYYVTYGTAGYKSTIKVYNAIATGQI
jgi:hypothetical protein